jgi:hypothetical protein
MEANFRRVSEQLLLFQHHLKQQQQQQQLVGKFFNETRNNDVAVVE